MASAAVLDPPGAPSSDGADGDIGDLAAWAGLAGNVLARLYRAFLLTLLVAAIVPALGSWSSLVVRTGSIEIVQLSDHGETVITIHGRGGFTGEANMLSNRRSLVRARGWELGRERG